MKLNTFATFAIPVLFLLAIGVSGQSTAGSPYGVVQIERFSVAQGVEFPENDLNELMNYLVLHFNDSRRFEQVFLSSDTAATTAPTRRVKITGQVTKYSKGNRAARYLVGFGAGRTKLVADVKVADAETGQVLFEQNVDGHVYGGFFGGNTDQAKGELASEIIKTMTKKGYASKTRKDK
jgi:hypothetical protein